MQTSQSVLDNLSQALNEIIAKYKELIGDGKLSFTDILSLMSSATGTLMKLVQNMALPDMTKKEAVLAAMGKFYDEVVAPIDIQVIPNIIEPIVDKALKQLLLMMVGGWIDALGDILTRDDDKDPVVPTPTPNPGPNPGPSPNPGPAPDNGSYKPIPFTPYLPSFLANPS